MTKEQLERANEIRKVLNAIDDMKFILRITYPMLCDRDDHLVDWVYFDEETRNGLKAVISDYLTVRTAELQKEFENL